MINKANIAKTHKNLQHVKHPEFFINCVDLSNSIDIIVGYKGKIKKHAPGLAQGKPILSR